MKNRQRIIQFLLVLLLSVVSILSFAQGDPTDSLPDDPAAIHVYTVQTMKFGAFTQGSGGTISISPSGARSVTGGVMAINIGVSYYQAIFEIVCPENSILNFDAPDATLTGNHGGSMTLHISDSDPAVPIVTSAVPPMRTTVNIGGRLTVGNPTGSPPGIYNGTFYIQFNYE